MVIALGLEGLVGVVDGRVHLVSASHRGLYAPRRLCSAAWDNER
jgi:hypothetical protein